MKQLDLTRTATCNEQVYLIEREAGLLCRILGLYAARALDVLRVEYACTAANEMKLHIWVDDEQPGGCEMADAVRVLVAKVSTLAGVIAVAGHIEDVAEGMVEREPGVACGAVT